MTVSGTVVPRIEPFRHVVAHNALSPALLDATLSWMETDVPWKLRIASFYEQWEVHLSIDMLPDDLKELLAPVTVARLASDLIGPIDDADVKLVEVTAHKLVAGQTIRVHNDFREHGESHRIIVQLNRGWRDTQGGLLMLFGSGSADDVRRIVRPTHGSAFAFAITERSFHAVSTISEGERFTLVFSFKAAASPGR